MDDPTQNSALADLGSETDKKLGHGTMLNDQAGCTDPGTTSQPSSTVAQDPKEQTPQTRARAESPKPHPQVPQLPPPSPGRPSTPSRPGRKHSTTSFKIDSMAFYVAPIPEARAQHDVTTHFTYIYNIIHVPNKSNQLSHPKCFYRITQSRRTQPQRQQLIPSFRAVQTSSTRGTKSLSQERFLIPTCRGRLFIGQGIICTTCRGTPRSASTQWTTLWTVRTSSGCGGTTTALGRHTRLLLLLLLFTHRHLLGRTHFQKRTLRQSLTN